MGLHRSRREDESPVESHSQSAHKRSHPKNEMQITVKANPVCPEMTFPLNVEASDTGSSVKTKINEVMGVAPSEQTLILSGKIVADDHALSSYNIELESTLQVMVPVK